MRDTSHSEVELRGVACLSTLMDGLCRDPPPAHVVVVATTHQLERVELSLRRPGRFEKELELPVPTSSNRLEVCESVYLCECGSGVCVCVCGGGVCVRVWYVWVSVWGLCLCVSVVYVRVCERVCVCECV